MNRKWHRKPVILTSMQDLARAIWFFVVFGAMFLLLIGLFIPGTALYKSLNEGPRPYTVNDRITGVCGFGTLSTVFITCGIFYTWRRRRALCTVSEEDLCRRFGVDQETLRQLTQEKQIEPRFLIDNSPHYELSDFGEAALLLRASSSPTGAEELLRAGGAPDSTPPNQLLRAQPEPLATAEKNREVEGPIAYSRSSPNQRA